MADLNSLLHWAVENSTPRTGQDGQAAQASAPSGSNPSGMQLTFKPAAPGQQPSQSTLAAFHPDDPQHDVGLAPPTAEEPADSHKPLTTEMLDLIMGKPDSVTMKEKMAIASNKSADVEERVDALDDFEMLIEMIDNANNMAILKLWQPLLALVNDPAESVARHALWICGTAIQNNLKGQAAFYIFGGLPLVLDKIYPTSGPQPSKATRAKAVYALSAALKHWPLASVALSEQDGRGYAALRAGVQDDDLVIRRKVCFMLTALVNQARDAFTGEMPSEVRNMIEEHAKQSGGDAKAEDLLAALDRNGVFEAAISALARDPKDDPEDAEYEENAMRALVRAAEFGGLKDEQKSQLKDIWTAWTPIGKERRGLEGADAEEISKVLA